VLPPTDTGTSGRSSAGITSSLLRSDLSLYAPVTTLGTSDELFSIFKQQLNPDSQLTTVSATVPTSDPEEPNISFHARRSALITGAMQRLRHLFHREGFHMTGLFLQQLADHSEQARLQALLFRDVDAIRHSLLLLQTDKKRDVGKHGKSLTLTTSEIPVSLAAPSSYSEAVDGVLAAVHSHCEPSKRNKTYDGIVDGVRGTLTMPKQTEEVAFNSRVRHEAFPPRSYVGNRQRILTHSVQQKQNVVGSKSKQRVAFLEAAIVVVGPVHRERLTPRLCARGLNSQLYEVCTMHRCSDIDSRVLLPSEFHILCVWCASLSTPLGTKTSQSSVWTLCN